MRELIVERYYYRVQVIEVREAVQRLLSETNTVVVATQGRHGVAAAALFFWADEHLNLYWLSSPESEHSVNLLANPEVAATVSVQAATWPEIRGVQLRGRARVADSREHLPSYRSKFALGSDFDAVIQRSEWYVFRPTWLRYIDNGKGFAKKWELHLDPESP